MRIVIIPGIDDSGPDHWQSIWQDELGDSAVRIRPTSFTAPDSDDWLDALDRLVEPGDLLVAHSLGCLAAATWLARGGSAAGAFLVAPPDESAPAFPQLAESFTAPRSTLNTLSLIVASADDPYCTPVHLEQLSRWWDAPLISVGRHGHLNAASGLAEWPEGRRLLTAFAAGIGERRCRPVRSTMDPDERTDQ